MQRKVEKRIGALARKEMNLEAYKAMHSPALIPEEIYDRLEKKRAKGTFTGTDMEYISYLIKLTEKEIGILRTRI